MIYKSYYCIYESSTSTYPKTTNLNYYWFSVTPLILKHWYKPFICQKYKIQIWHGPDSGHHMKNHLLNVSEDDLINLWLPGGKKVFWSTFVYERPCFKVLAEGKSRFERGTGVDPDDVYLEVHTKNYFHWWEKTEHSHFAFAMYPWIWPFIGLSSKRLMKRI